jgi:hypothetical protein
MVEIIVRVTVWAVFAVAAANMLHGVRVAIRLARHVSRTKGADLSLWLPTFRSLTDVHTWLSRWRAIVMSKEPAMVAIRRESRQVVGRYLHLMVMSNAWGMAVTAIAPALT